jgi:endoribonuclease Dicer
MVGYVQSRGRARHKTSTFIVMAQEGQQETLSRYTAFVETEPQLKQFYQQQAATQPKVDEVLEEGELENDDDRDLADRERYTVESTKATLTYHSAIGLLGHLCSLIPRDKFTAAQVPIYTGDFEVTLTLPSSLPLPTQYLRWKGPGRHSKKEAKRAVAFLAVKTLHQIGVFDDYLLPVKSSRDADAEDAEGRRVIDWGYIPDLMGVHVRDPWTVDEKLWMHVVYIDNRPVAGLVTGTQLSHADTQLDLDTTHIQIGAARRMVLEYDTSQREILQTYTRIGVWWSVTGRGTKLPLACYLVPLASSLKPDWENMEQVVASPIGSPDWSGIGEDRYHQLLCMNYKEYGRPLMLRRIRHDLSPLSTPPPGSREEGYETYHAYWTAAYTRKGVPPEISTEGPLIEMHVVSRQMSGGYELYPSEQPREPQEATVTNGFLVPMDLARWINLSMDMWAVFKILPRLLHRATDVYRARCARTELALPPLETNLLVEAHTLPNVAAKHSNQRLETLGDSILKFGIVVHLFNRFPHRHEGQLDVIRRGSVSNKTLLSRACDIDLSRFISSETETMRNWRYVLPEETKWKEEPRAMRYVPRSLPRNSMQDCMESTLGAAFVAGGIDTALRTATALGLALGGPIPWSLRYGRNPESGTRSALFHELQEGHLQYQFHREELLLEALTHPSFKTDVTSSYQRLEFLGDGRSSQIALRGAHTERCCSFDRCGGHGLPLSQVPESELRTTVLGTISRGLWSSAGIRCCAQTQAS